VTRSVSINALQTIALGANPVICQGVITTTIPFTTTGSPNQYSIDYDPTANAAGFSDIINGTLGASPRALTIPGTVPTGVYNAVFTVRNSTTGCISIAYPLTITVNARPVPTITGPASACVGSTGNLYTTESGMTGYTWVVSAGGTVTAGTGTNSITVSWITTGSKTVTVNYTNANGCNATAATTYSVTVNANPAVPTTPVNGFRCGPGTVSISATAAAGTTIDWYGTLSGGTLLGTG
jgi:hypothetical protein